MYTVKYYYLSVNFVFQNRGITISDRVIHQDENFSESTLWVGSLDPHNACTLRSLPLPLLDISQERDSVICGVNHIIKSLSRFKRYNTSNPAQIITNEGKYFCMSISTTKRGNLGSYKRITMCKSCDNGDPHDPH